jgi:hypothetical protein
VQTPSHREHRYVGGVWLTRYSPKSCSAVLIPAACIRVESESAAGSKWNRWRGEDRVLGVGSLPRAWRQQRFPRLGRP